MTFTEWWKTTLVSNRDDLRFIAEVAWKEGQASQRETILQHLKTCDVRDDVNAVAEQSVSAIPAL